MCLCHNIIIHSNIRSKKIFSEVYKKRKMTYIYMSVIKDRFLEFLLFCSLKPFFISLFFIIYTSGGTNMEIRLHWPF